MLSNIYHVALPANLPEYCFCDYIVATILNFTWVMKNDGGHSSAVQYKLAAAVDPLITISSSNSIVSRYAHE